MSEDRVTQAEWHASRLGQLFQRCKDSSDTADTYHTEWDELEDVLRSMQAVVDAARGITDPNWMEGDTIKKSEERLRRAMWELDGGR